MVAFKVHGSYDAPMPIPFIPFYMIRHGESTANLQEIASGHMDVALTEKGQKQAEAARAVVESLEHKPSVIIHSNLSRARDTARIINANLGLPMYEDPSIAEQHYGEWEGQSWSITRQPTRDGVDPPGGEAHRDFQERVRGAISSFITTHPGPALIVCHGGVFRAFGALYQTRIFGIENCCLHHFSPSPDTLPLPWNISKLRA
ncbi:MAG: histidine phosphatase family protein [Micavibrio sp.]